MSVELPKVKEDFASIVGSLTHHPWKMLQFILWLDLKLAEYKVNGFMLLDPTLENLPEWLDTTRRPDSIKVKTPSPERPACQGADRECVSDHAPTTSPMSTSEADHSTQAMVFETSYPQNLPKKNKLSACSKHNIDADHHQKETLERIPNNTPMRATSVAGCKRPKVQYTACSSVVPEIQSKPKVLKITATTSPDCAGNSNISHVSSSKDLTLPALDSHHGPLGTSSSQSSSEGLLARICVQDTVVFPDNSSLQNAASSYRSHSNSSQARGKMKLVQTTTPRALRKVNLKIAPRNLASVPEGTVSDRILFVRPGSTANSEIEPHPIFMTHSGSRVHSNIYDVNKDISYDNFVLRMVSLANTSTCSTEDPSNVASDVIPVCRIKHELEESVMGRGVPVIIPPDLIKPLEYLANPVVRGNAAILEENKYLFPNSVLGSARAYDCLTKLRAECTLKSPERLTSVSLRKYTSTITQVKLEKSTCEDECRSTIPEHPREEEEEHIVERVLDVRFRKGRKEYLMKWKNRSNSENTWDRDGHLRCPELITEFEKELNNREVEGRKKRRQRRPRSLLQPESFYKILKGNDVYPL